MQRLYEVLCRWLAVSPEAHAAHRALKGLSITELPVPTLLSQSGFSHQHYELPGTELIIRVPRTVRPGSGALGFLKYQRAAYIHAQPSGHSPAFLGLIPPSPTLLQGALLIARVTGRAPYLPFDLPALRNALFSLHTQPSADDQGVLAAPRDPVGDLIMRLRSEAGIFDCLQLDAVSRLWLEAEFAAIQGMVSEEHRQRFPKSFTVQDCHPGNFRVDAAGKAWFLDLEKAEFGNPLSDLAHLTLYTSISWHRPTAKPLEIPDLIALYQSYLKGLPDHLRECSKPGIIPLRRLVHLRTLCWAARQLITLREGKMAEVSHFAIRLQRLIDLWLAPERLTAQSAEWGALERML